jgi:hypothetical protein
MAMVRVTRLLLGLGLVAGSIVAIGVDEAAARCTRLGYSVNDYGKEGPTRDAKALLDKYIASWAAERGIKKYNVGKKSVKCELFLDFGFFDEHTCRAEATVCWPDGAAPATATPPKAPKKAPEKSADSMPGDAPASPAPPIQLREPRSPEGPASTLPKQPA